MFNEYFGNYLTRSGLLKPEQLRSLLQQESGQQVKLGTLAIDAGYMTGAQVEEIHKLQKRQDKRFGDLAVEAGWLTSGQLENLLNLQVRNRLFLSQAIVDAGYLTFTEIDKALKDYKEETGLDDKEWANLRQGDITVILKRLLAGNDRQAQDYRRYLALLVKNFMRFVYEKPVIVAVTEDCPKKDLVVVQQSINGDLTMDTAIAMPSDSAVGSAVVFSGEVIKGIDDTLVKESLQEFLNMHNGLFTVALSNDGRETNLQPPCYFYGKEEQRIGKGICVELELSHGSVFVLLK